MKCLFLDALASLDFKLSVAQSVIFFTASAFTGLSDLFGQSPKEQQYFFRRASYIHFLLDKIFECHNTSSLSLVFYVHFVICLLAPQLL